MSNPPPDELDDEDREYMRQFAIANSWHCVGSTEWTEATRYCAFSSSPFMRRVKHAAFETQGDTDG
jgi:hypothetical protein